MKVLRMAAIGVVLGIFTLAGCKKTTQTAISEKHLALSLLKTIEGLNAPECMLPDSKNGVVYVSNIATGNQGYWSADGVGFISLLDSDGVLKTLRWVNSSTSMPINAPKGMCILGDSLYFTDIDRLMRCNLSSRKLDNLPLPHTKKLNDLAADSDAVLVSDMEAGKLLRVKPDGSFSYIPAPESINGVTVHKGRIYAVSWGLHDIYELDRQGKKAPVAFGLADYFSSLDGIEVLDDGTFLVSDFIGGKICAIDANRHDVTTLAELASPADIGIDRRRNRLYVPQLQVNRAAIYQMEYK